jgi:2-methylcitrate dehydratase PrpD
MGPGGEAGGREARLVSATLARFIAESRWEDVPAEIRREAKRGILNVAGCIAYGRAEPEMRLLERAFPGESALLDAAAATALDYDDTHLRTVIHATPTVGAAVFSLTRQKSVPGADFLHAFVLGVETACRIGNAVMPGHYERGWHITSTCGVFGAAAAACRFLHLKETQVRHALAFAATQASGTVEVLGSMARILNAGFAARNGIAAARLAQEGFEGPPRPIEGLRGFVNVFGGNADLAAIDGELGSRWDLTGIEYKPYPCGVVLHALIDACLEMKKPSLESIEVKLSPLAIERTDRPQPRDLLEARLSAQHAVAVALVRGRAGLAEFSAGALADPEVLKMRNRVKVLPDKSLDKMEAVVTDGRQTVRRARSRPMDDARLEAKLRELAGPRADAWLQFTDKLETAERVVLPF